MNSWLMQNKNHLNHWATSLMPLHPPPKGQKLLIKAWYIFLLILTKKMMLINILLTLPPPYFTFVWWWILYYLSMFSAAKKGFCDTGYVWFMNITFTDFSNSVSVMVCIKIILNASLVLSEHWPTEVLWQ